MNPRPSAGATLRHRLVSASVALLGALACSGVQAQSYPVYAITALPISGFVAFNDQGLILGRGFLPCSGICSLSDAAVLYDTRSGSMTGLPSPSGWITQWGAINARGELAGTQIGRDASGAVVRSVVIRRADGSLAPVTAPALPATLGSPLQARGLNGNGQIALQYSEGQDLVAPDCGTTLGWLGSTAGTWQALGPAGTLVSLSGLNAAGRAVGAAVPSVSCGGAGVGYRAVASQADGSLIDLHGSLPGAFSRALAINDLGYAVGEYDTGLRSAPDAYNPQGVPITHAVVWNTASLARFDLSPPGTLGRLNGANARGEVVGRATGPVSPTQPLVGATTVAVLGNLATTWPMVDLNTLLAGNIEGWVLHEALAVNAGGQIVARGASAAGSGYALLTPVQPPADPYATPPSAPASLSAAALSATSVQLAWQNTARNATRLVVERCKGGSCTGFTAVATLPGDTSGWVDGSLSKRTTYRYRVRAGNATGLSAPSDTVTVTTLR